MNTEPKIILFPTGGRSDQHLIEPIHDEILKLEPAVIVPFFVQLEAGDFMRSFIMMKNNLTLFEPVAVFCTGDRIEMMAAACAAFEEGVPVIHYFAGVVNDPIDTLDDINRHCITLFSELQLCESWRAYINVYKLFKPIKKKMNAKIVGSTHYDSFEIDLSKVPSLYYDLVLYNPPATIKTFAERKRKIKQDVAMIVQIARDQMNYIVWVGPNADKGRTTVIRELMNHDTWIVRYHENLPRAQFLGLLSNCQRFITNSSAAYYEAPMFLPPGRIIMIGDRNKNRTLPEVGRGAAKKIAEVLKEWVKEK